MMELFISLFCEGKLCHINLKLPHTCSHSLTLTLFLVFDWWLWIYGILTSSKTLLNREWNWLYKMMIKNGSLCLWIELTLAMIRLPVWRKKCMPKWKGSSAQRREKGNFLVLGMILCWIWQCFAWKYDNRYSLRPKNFFLFPLGTNIKARYEMSKVSL